MLWGPRYGGRLGFLPKIIKVDIDEQAKLKTKDLRQVCTQNFDVHLHCSMYSTDIPVLYSVARSWQVSAANL